MEEVLPPCICAEKLQANMRSMPWFVNIWRSWNINYWSSNWRDMRRRRYELQCLEELLLPCICEEKLQANMRSMPWCVIIWRSWKITYWNSNWRDMRRRRYELQSLEE